MLRLGEAGGESNPSFLCRDVIIPPGDFAPRNGVSLRGISLREVGDPPERFHYAKWGYFPPEKFPSRNERSSLTN